MVNLKSDKDINCFKVFWRYNTTSVPLANKYLPKFYTSILCAWPHIIFRRLLGQQMRSAKKVDNHRYRQMIYDEIPPLKPPLSKWNAFVLYFRICTYTKNNPIIILNSRWREWVWQ